MKPKSCPSYRHHQPFSLGKFLLISIEREELRHPKMERGSNVENVKTAMASFDRVLERKTLSDLVHVSPIDGCVAIKPRFDIGLMRG